MGEYSLKHEIICRHVRSFHAGQRNALGLVVSQVDNQALVRVCSREVINARNGRDKPQINPVLALGEIQDDIVPITWVEREPVVFKKYLLTMQGLSVLTLD